VKRDVHFEAIYPFPVERVWRAITDPVAIADWLMPNDFRPVVGHRFRFTAPPQPGWDGIVDCEVREVDPPRRLVYTWVSKSNGVDTVVTWTLEPVAGGTRLRLDHTGFRGARSIIVSFILGSGWKGIVRKGILTVVERYSGDTYISQPR
jgi:uncharacterized protein YndB with AHSA1/START domain